MRQTQHIYMYIHIVHNDQCIWLAVYVLANKYYNETLELNNVRVTVSLVCNRPIVEMFLGVSGLFLMCTKLYGPKRVCRRPATYHENRLGSLDGTKTAVEKNGTRLSNTLSEE